MTIEKPGLFGLRKTNRDFKSKDAWGKNQFNSSFPASLCCYLENQGIEANYLSIQKSSFCNTFISIKDVFGISTNSNDIFFAFENQYTPFQKYVIGPLPRTDLVIQRESTGECLASVEIKLTALPDHTTCDLRESSYGSELVVRPDTIVYLACSIATNLKSFPNNLLKLKIEDWSDAIQVLPHFEKICKSIYTISKALERSQSPFLLQPIWKTMGKSPMLAKDCLDVFIWSDAGFTNFLSKIANNISRNNQITRHARTVIWLYKMLSEIDKNGNFNPQEIIDNLSYNTKNDKAFASGGIVTHQFMSCPRLEKPVIAMSQIKNIILGGGQNLLSPERRFDSIIVNSPELFK